MKNVASAAFRSGVSRRAAALIATATLEDVGLVSAESKARVIVDKNKVTRAMTELRRNLTKEAETQRPKICGLYFDGRVDVTKERVKRGNKYYDATKVGGLRGM